MMGDSLSGEMAHNVHNAQVGLYNRNAPIEWRKIMLHQRLQKIGDRYIITIPAEEIERQHLQEGQLLSVEIHPADNLSEDIKQAFEASWQRNAAGYEYLKGR
jgi:hypothetical protein